MPELAAMARGVVIRLPLVSRIARKRPEPSCSPATSQSHERSHLVVAAQHALRHVIPDDHGVPCAKRAPQDPWPREACDEANGAPTLRVAAGAVALRSFAALGGPGAGHTFRAAAGTKAAAYSGGAIA